MRVTKTPTGNIAVTLSSATIQVGVAAALQQVNATDTLMTRKHDAAVLTIPNKSGTPVEIQVDDLTAGLALTSAVKQIEFSCTFPEPVEVLVGATAGSAVRKFIASAGDSTMSVVCIIASGSHIYLRTLDANSITNGVLTLNLLG